MARKTNLAFRLWRRAKASNIIGSGLAERFLRGLVPDNILAPANTRYLRFKPSHHVRVLHLNDGFLRGLTNNTRVLEIGSHTGGLTDYLLGKSKLRPENYTLLDRLYITPHIPLKRKVAELVKRKKIRMIAADYHEYDFGNEQWNHILMPASLFPRKGAKSEEVHSDMIKAIEKILRHVEIGGTLRVSHLWPGVLNEKHAGFFSQLHAFLTKGKEQNNLEYTLTDSQEHRGFNGHGLIITKLRKTRERE